MLWDMVSPKGGLCMHHCEFNHCLPQAVPTKRAKEVIAMLRNLLSLLLHSDPHCEDATLHFTFLGGHEKKDQPLKS
jgi:hypothetical protein